MYQRYVILREEIPTELTRNQVRHIIANYYRLDAEEVLMNENVPPHQVCTIRQKVIDKSGKVVGVQG